MKFLTTFLVTACLASLLYLTVAWIVNPRGDFSSEYFPRVIISSQRDKISQFAKYRKTHRAEGLILGSSRTMKLNPRDFTLSTGLQFFNFGVFSARTEDDLAIYRYVKAQTGIPKLLIIGLDVEALHNHLEFDAELKNNKTLCRELALKPESFLSSSYDLWNQIKETFTFGYAVDICHSALIKMRMMNSVSEYAFDSLGYLHYLNREKLREEGAFDLNQNIDSSLFIYYLRFKDMNGLSAERKDYLERLIHEALKDHAKIKLWITCVHPRAIQYLRQRTQYASLLSQTEDYVRHLKNTYGIETYDFSDISKYGGSIDGWYDCAHIDESNATKIERKLTNGL